MLHALFSPKFIHISSSAKWQKCTLRLYIALRSTNVNADLSRNRTPKEGQNRGYRPDRGDDRQTAGNSDEDIPSRGRYESKNASDSSYNFSKVQEREEEPRQLRDRPYDKFSRKTGNPWESEGRESRGAREGDNVRNVRRLQGDGDYYDSRSRNSYESRSEGLTTRASFPKSYGRKAVAKLEFYEDELEDEDFASPSNSDQRLPPSVAKSLRGEVVYGVAPVLNALRFKRRTIYTLYIQDSMNLGKRKDGAAVEKITEMAAEAGIPVVPTPKHNLNMLCGDRPHQGLILDASPLKWTEMDSFPEASAVATTVNGTPPLWLLLDEVTDPQNFGAIVRAAYCLGVTGVMFCDRNCAPMSAAACKASAGVLEAAELYGCSNMPRTLEDAVNKGWAVLGAAADTNSSSIRQAKLDRPTILVIGSEGEGLRANVRRACTSFVKVDMGLGGGRGRVVDSLNVSVATGILLHTLMGSVTGPVSSNSDSRSEYASGDVRGVEVERAVPLRSRAPVEQKRSAATSKPIKDNW